MKRRSLFKAGAAFAATAAAPFFALEAGQRLQSGDDAGTIGSPLAAERAPNQRLLLKGGTVVSLDPTVGDFVKGDVLIEGKKIVNVAAEIQAPPQAQVTGAPRPRSS